MKRRKLNIDLLSGFASFLKNEKKSDATIEKYMRDVCFFCRGKIEKER